MEVSLMLSRGMHEMIRTRVLAYVCHRLPLSGKYESVPRHSAKKSQHRSKPRHHNDTTRVPAGKQDACDDRGAPLFFQHYPSIWELKT